MQTKSLAELDADFGEEAQQEILRRLSSWFKNISVIKKDGQVVVRYGSTYLNTDSQPLDHDASVLVLTAVHHVASAAVREVHDAIEGGSK